MTSEFFARLMLYVVGSVLLLWFLGSCESLRIEESRESWEAACIAFQPIYLEDSYQLSQRDSTKIAQHNVVWEGLCPKAD